MEGIINSIVQFLQQGIAAIFKFLQLVWNWSFGQIVSVFSSDWQSLPIWKIVVLIIALAAIAYILYKAFMVLWSGVVALFHAFVELLGKQPLQFLLIVLNVSLQLLPGLLQFAGGVFEFADLRFELLATLSATGLALFQQGNAALGFLQFARELVIKRLRVLDGLL